MPVCRRHRLRQSVVQQHAIGQLGEKIVLGQIRHPERHRAGYTDVMENDHRARHLPAPVVNGSRSIFNGSNTTYLYVLPRSVYIC